MSKPGRPVLFDTAKQNIFFRLIAAGIPASRAARHVGVSPSTIREKARTSPAFHAAYEKAKSEAVADLLQSVNNAGTRSWRASAWLLERLRPEEFGRRQPLPPPPPAPKQAQPSYAHRLHHLDDNVVNDFFDYLAFARHSWQTARERFAQFEQYIADDKRRHEEYLRWAKVRGHPLPPQTLAEIAALEAASQPPESEPQNDAADHHNSSNPNQSLPAATANADCANNPSPVSPPQNP